MRVIKNDIICEKKFKEFDWQGQSKTIYIFNDKILIKKTDKKEINNIILIYNKLKKKKINILLALNYKIYKCNDYYLLFMKRYKSNIEYIDYKDNEINNINEFKNVVLQVLLLSLYLNFKLKIFHNDLHSRNILYKLNDNKESIIINFEDINLKLGKFIIKVIDWEHMEKHLIIKNMHSIVNKYIKPKLRNSEFFYNLIFIHKKIRIINNKITKIPKVDRIKNISKIIKLQDLMNNENNLEAYIKIYKYIDENFIEIFSD